ncbi:MAG: hypothetical protein KatS3mg104_1539 [Phycisphaerae bacterium]|nr:MAG: hypothetical protein KatS3mg104_1539 [Phycisphaerae bacterium]
MKDSSASRTFGVTVAYVLPGFLTLFVISPVVPAIAQWLQPVGQSDWELAPPLYAILAATLIGMVLSCFRWVLLDPLHQCLGINRPEWDDERLGESLEGFDYLVLNHYRYYEFCSNTLLAAAGGYLLNRVLGTADWLNWITDVAVVAICVVLFAASHSALKNYYARTGKLLGFSTSRSSGDNIMYNGNDHGGATTAATGQDGNAKPSNHHSSLVDKLASSQTKPLQAVPAHRKEQAAIERDLPRG